jgi:hypothetical protein
VAFGGSSAYARDVIAHVAGLPVEELLPLIPAAGALLAVCVVYLRSFTQGRSRTDPGSAPSGRPRPDRAR